MKTIKCPYCESEKVKKMDLKKMEKSVIDVINVAKLFKNFYLMMQKDFLVLYTN